MNQETDNAANHQQLIRWFRQATPYINVHRGKTFVVMLSGEAVAHNNIRNIVHDIALLNSLGIRLVIIHGIRAQLDSKLAQQNINSTFVRGLRVSDKATMDAAIEAASLVRSQLETRLSMGLSNSPMHGARVRVASANAITAKPAGIIDGVDLQHTGMVRKIDTVAINTLLELGNVILLSPLGYSPTGEAFSLGYEQVAGEMAMALNADKLIAFTNSDGVYDSEGVLLRELNPSQAQSLVTQSLVTKEEPVQDHHGSELTRCLNTAIAAVKAGVPRAHLMNYASDGALLEELFTVDGAGTLIMSASFESTRTAVAEDVPAIIDIITPLEEQGVLVRRERDKLEDEIERFTVVEREGFIVALAALYPYPDSGIGEIACIVTHPDYRNGERGKNLLRELEASARKKGLSAVFVLTTQTSHWFIENGFSDSTLDDLPQQKQSLYNYQRNSKVLIKKL